MNKELYFKVYIDFTRYIPIDQTELEKALYAFQTGKPVMFEMGAATRIESIIPDFNKSAGWSSDYKPTADDFADIDRVKPRYTGYIGKIKEKINILIQSGKTNLIGKNIPMEELLNPENKLLE
jgi:hypothetical protein